MQYSNYQKKIFDFIDKDDRSLIIEAKAGSGKTTTIIEALKLIPPQKKIVFLAFNKQIQETLSAKVTPQTKCFTFHGLCYYMLKKTKYKNFTIDKNKTNKIIKSVIENDLKSKEKIKAISNKLKDLVSLAKGLAIRPDTENKTQFLDKIIKHHDIDFESIEQENYAINLANKILRAGDNWLSENNNLILDFDDLLYFCALKDDIVFLKNDFAFVDEAQDISDVQRLILTKLLKQNGRMIAVGDSCQSVYGFRGAGIDAMQLLKKQFNCASLPLSISYRCPLSVVNEARKYSNIEPFSQAIQGTVLDKPSGLYGDCKFEDGDYIICRNNAPLIKLAYHVLNQKIPINFQGKNLDNQLIKFIDSLKASTIADLKEKIFSWQTNETKRLIEKNEEYYIPLVDDKAYTLFNFITLARPKTIKKLKEEINWLFKLKGGVKISTIHKSKGLEAKNIFLLDRDLMPSPLAKKPWQKQQEYNLLYVAITRAQKNLTYIYSPKEKTKKFVKNLEKENRKSDKKFEKKIVLRKNKPAYKSKPE